MPIFPIINACDPDQLGHFLIQFTAALVKLEMAKEELQYEQTLPLIAKVHYLTHKYTLNWKLIANALNEDSPHRHAAHMHFLEKLVENEIRFFPYWKFWSWK